VAPGGRQSLQSQRPALGWTGRRHEQPVHALGSEWDGFTVHPRAFHGAGDSVIVEGRYTGTFKPTGKSMDTQFCHVWDIKDGKVTRFQQYVDTAKLHDVMGSK
jgi:ketosteroid isomerase-like protein